MTVRLPINYLDTGKVSRDKINNSFNEMVTTVQWYRPHIENWIRRIWNTNTWVKAYWDSIDMKVEDWYIRYKSESQTNWTQIIAVADLKWDKGDKWDPFTYDDFTEEQLVALTWPQWPRGEKWNKWDKWDTGEKWDKGDTGEKWDKGDTGETWPQWPQWDKGDKGEKWEQWVQGIQWPTWDAFAVYKTYPSIASMNADKNNVPEWKFVMIVSTVEDPDNAKLYVKWASDFTFLTDMSGATGMKWDKGDQWVQGEQWVKGDTGASITSAAFSWDNIVFGKDDQTSVTLVNAKTELKWEKGDKWDKWDKGDQWPAWPWSWNVIWPNSAWDENIALYDWTTWKLIKDSWLKVSDIKWNWVEVNVATAYWTAAKVWTTTAWDYTPTKWDFLLVNFVDGCNVDNPTLNIDWSWAKAIRTGSANATKSTFTLWTTANSNIKALLYYDWTYYRCWSTTNSNTTYSAMSVSEWKTGTATSSRAMRADYLKQIIKYHAVSDTAYDSTWDWKTDIAPSQNAVYDKIESLSIPTKTSDLTNDSGYITSADVPTKTSDLTNDSWFITSAALPTKTSDLTNDSWFITSSALSWYQTTANLVTNLSNADNTHYPSAKAVADALSSAWAGDMLKSVYDPNNVAANVYDYSNFINTPTIPTKVSDLTNDAGYITSSAIPTDYVKTSWNQTIAWTKTFSTSPVVPSKSTDATNTATAIATEAQVYKKQDKLTTQTAYTSKGTATKVPTITTNTLWQVTAITETSITFPVTSVNGSTWAVTWLQTTANLKTSLTDNSDTYYPSQKAVKTAVDGKQNQHSTLSVTLTSAGWSSNTQTVTATGVTASNSVIVSPAPSSFSGYSSSAIYCSAQASNSLTFSCTTEPTSDITVNVLILN